MSEGPLPARGGHKISGTLRARALGWPYPLIPSSRPRAASQPRVVRIGGSGLKLPRFKSQISPLLLGDFGQ